MELMMYLDTKTFCSPVWKFFKEDIPRNSTFGKPHPENGMMFIEAIRLKETIGLNWKMHSHGECIFANVKV